MIFWGDLMNGHERRAQAKRNAILDAAFRLFNEKGYASTTVSEIAKCAGVSQVTLFKYFGDKLALTRETIHRFMDTVMPRFEAMISADVPYTVKMGRMLLFKREEQLKIGDWLYNEMRWDDPVIQSLIADFLRERVRTFYVDLFTQAEREGSLPTGVSIELAVAYVTMWQKVITQQDMIRRENIEGLYHLFLYGLMGMPPGADEKDRRA